MYSSHRVASLARQGLRVSSNMHERWMVPLLECGCMPGLVKKKRPQKLVRRAPLWHNGAVGRRGRDAYGPPSHRGRVVNDEKRHHKTAVEMDVLFFDMAPSWLKEPAQLRERARVPC